MKKNKFLKMFLTFVCILSISIVSEHVYGYQLKYKAIASSKNDIIDGAIVRTYGNTFGYPPSDFIYGNWISNVDNSFSYSEQAYRTYQIVFHDTLISNYIEGWNSNGSTIDIGYDQSKTILNSSDLEASSAEINMNTYVETKSATVTGKNDDVYNNGLHFSRGSSDFYADKVTYLKINASSNQTITVSDWYISKNAINKIKEKWPESNNSNQIYFSLPAKTGNIFTVNNVGNWYSSYSAANYIVWYNNELGNERLGKCK